MEAINQGELTVWWLSGRGRVGTEIEVIVLEDEQREQLVPRHKDYSFAPYVERRQMGCVGHIMGDVGGVRKGPGLYAELMGNHWRGLIM